MLNALSRFERPVALFLDELQALRSDSTLRFFRAVLPRLPQQSRVFIGSRTLPDVGVATLRVNGVAIGLRAEDLRFSADEASEFFAKDARPGIGAGEIGAIYRRTEGTFASDLHGAGGANRSHLYRISISNNREDAARSAPDRTPAMHRRRTHEQPA
jgi:ATP/maltotriose-dependent transcriptional regulator MalT